MWSKKRTELTIHSIGIVTLSFVILAIICARRCSFLYSPNYEKIASFREVADSLEAIGSLSFADSMPLAEKPSKEKPSTERLSAKKIEAEKISANHSSSKKITVEEPVQKRAENFKSKIIELNGADSVALLSLKGIGPYYVWKILSYRERLGGFVSREQLLEIGGIDSARFALFCNNVKIDTSLVEWMRLSEVGEDKLSANPYIGSRYAKNIIKWREMVPADSCIVEVFARSNVLPQKSMLRILPYLR